MENLDTHHSSRPESIHLDPNASDYRVWLFEVFKSKTIKNRLFSIRAFAIRLGVGKTTLAEVFSGKRHLSKRNAERVCAALDLSPEIRAWFLTQIPKNGRSK